MTVQTFVVVMKTSSGAQITWETLAQTGCKALLAAQELLPENVVLKIHRVGDW